MALIGPNPTIASISSLVRTSNGDELNQILDEVVKCPNDTLLTSLAANDATQSKLSEYFTKRRLVEAFSHLQESSDPKFVALSWLADGQGDPIRSDILDIISTSPMNPASLNVFARLLSKSNLPLRSLKDSTVEQIMYWLKMDEESGNTAESNAQLPSSQQKLSPQERSLLSTLVIKPLSKTHKSCITRFVEYNLDKDSDASFAVIRALVNELPELTDLVWSYKGETTPEFFRMLSVLCNSQSTRDKVATSFQTIVQTAANSGSVIAAVVDAKLLASVTEQTGNINEARSRLDMLSATLFEPDINQVSIEGLACTALLTSVRTRLAKQSPGQKNTVIFNLVELLKAKYGVFGYAVLAVLVPLCRYPMKPTKEEQQQSSLRIQSLGKSVFDYEVGQNLSNDSAKMQARRESGLICDQVVKSSLLNWVTANVTRLSLAAHEQLAYLLAELCSHQDLQRRQKLALQGAAVIAMYLWSTGHPRQLSAEIRAVAASAISKILASVPPQVALTEKVNKHVVVMPLTTQINNPDSKRKNLDTFESLRALTNLSSLPDENLRTAIAKNVWPRMIDALNCEFIQVRRSCLELICNLMLVMPSASHFLKSTPESHELLSLLGSSVVCDDPDSRIAAAGSLAILAEWATGASHIGHNNDCVDGLCKSLNLFHNDNALLVRVLSALRTIIETCRTEKEDEVVEAIAYHEGLVKLEELEESIDPTSPTEVTNLVLQVLKLIAEYKLDRG